MLRPTLLSILLLAATTDLNAADSNPPAITWEWYKAAETYRNYPKRQSSDLKIAARYHLRAAKQGNAASAYKLGEMFENGIGVPKDLKAAFKWYEVSAATGDRHAEFRLGYLYQKGLGVEKSASDALLWYGKASAQGNEWADHMLGFMFADGDGVTKDARAARKYFEASLPRTNDHWAMWKLALLLERSDPARAKKLLRQSAAAGNPDARKLLGDKRW